MGNGAIPLSPNAPQGGWGGSDLNRELVGLNVIESHGYK